MYQDVIIAGFGGQGVMLIGNLLAHGAMEEGLNVTYMPVYGVEMRGGTANCTVVISDEEIGSPIIFYPRSLIVMNQPSLEKFHPRLERDGVVIVNSSIVPNEVVNKERGRVYLVPANDIADDLGNFKMANMVALGAWVGATKSISLESLYNCLSEVLSHQDKEMLEKNKEALVKGWEYVGNVSL